MKGIPQGFLGLSTEAESACFFLLEDSWLASMTMQVYPEERKG